MAKSSSKSGHYQHPTLDKTIVVRLELPEHIYDHYASQALQAGQEPESVIASRLTRCKDITGTGIYFNEEEKKRLCHVIGHTVGDAEGALQRLETQSKIHVAGLEIELEPRLLQRMKTRVFRGQTYEQVLRKEVISGLRRFAGLDPA